MRSIQIFVALLWLCQGLAQASIDSDYVAELTLQSRQLKLSERPEWHKLLHYIPDKMTPHYQGLVDSPGFYLAADGKTDPQAELEATLANFFSDELETRDSQNPQCSFVARYSWLKQQLKFEAARMPSRFCKRYQQWREELNPGGITLIFASAYLNSPSSMYGHTLLRVDAKDQDEHTRLLAYAVNFAANTDETNGIAFAVNGLFGGYAGTFSMLPYYAKVLEYSDFENRDLWEYQLNLTSDEIDLVLMHAWELGPHYFKYYFFDENCAYHLLGLLQVARPEFDFTGQFRWAAVPADTVRAIKAQTGLVARTVYRPANATLLRNSLAQMNAQELDLISALSQRRIAADSPVLQQMPRNRAAAVLEASQDYVSYERATGKTKVTDAAALAHELQSARSRVDIITPPQDKHEPKVKPDEGHRSSRISAGVGRRDAQTFQELRMRATYHDLMDKEEGYVRGAEIEFFSLALRHDDLLGTRVESFMPLSIMSLAPRDDFFHAPSWRVSAGWRRAAAASGAEPLAAAVDGSAGGAWSNQQNDALVYTLLDAGARIHSQLDSGYALGLGASMGGYFDVNSDWRVHGYARGLRSFLGQRDAIRELGIEQRYAIGRDAALRVDWSRKRELQRNFNTVSASLLAYF